LLISNDFHEKATFRIWVEGDAATAVKLKRLHWIDGVADIPQDYAPTDLLELGSGDSMPFMLSFSAKQLPPGLHEIRLMLSPLDLRLPERVIHCHFKTLPYRLPDALPIQTFAWDYNMAAQDSVMDLLHGMRVNTFMVTVSETDFRNLHAMIDTIDRHGLRDSSFLFLETWFIRNATEWKPEFDQWLDQLEAEMASRNWPRNRWVLHIFDEVFSEPFYRAATAIKAKHPHIPLFSDVIASQETIDKFAPVIDFWCPHIRQRVEQREEHLAELKAMRATHPVWVYDCDSTATYPVERYRFMPWLSWLDGDHGLGFWCLGSMTLRPAPGKANWGSTYTFNGKLVPSRRLWMFAAGLEDYLLLAKAAEIAPEETRTLAERVLAAFGKPEFAHVVEEARAALLSRIEQGH
jgi:hypothetical protein